MSELEPNQLPVDVNWLNRIIERGVPQIILVPCSACGETSYVFVTRLLAQKVIAAGSSTASFPDVIHNSNCAPQAFAILAFAPDDSPVPSV